MRSEWTYTIPITRAEEDANGQRYLIGEASGPERDTHGTEMAPEAIIDFQRQIIERAAAGDPIPYKDSHGKGGGVLQDLGWVVDASVTPNFHLIVRVALDDANPAADFLHRSVARGKQYGMSVAGSVQNFVMSKDESGGRVIRFLRVALREISNTTKPSWVPSFGTVLARSVEGEQGVTDMEDNLDTTAVRDDEQTTVDEASPVELNAGTEPVVENDADDANPTPTDNVEEESIERGLSQSAKADLLAAFSTLQQQLSALGVIPSAPENTATETTVSEAARDTSETGDTEDARTDSVEFNGLSISRELADAINAAVAVQVEAAVKPLQEAIAERDARIEELENLPAGHVPGKVAREKFSGPADEFSEQLSRMSPDERLRWALTKVYEG